MALGLVEGSGSCLGSVRCKEEIKGLLKTGKPEKSET